MTNLWKLLFCEDLEQLTLAPRDTGEVGSCDRNTSRAHQRKGDSCMFQDDNRRSAPATLRNREPILDVLRPLLSRVGLVLEIASGTSQHVVHFARGLPKLTWQPSDNSATAGSEPRRSLAKT